MSDFNDIQNIIETKLYNFIQSLECDTKMKLSSLANVLKVIKLKFKYTTCSKCHFFKQAARHCQNRKCQSYMKQVQCPFCLRLFLKLGKHRCRPDNMFVPSTSKSLEQFDNYINNNSEQFFNDKEDIDDSYNLHFQEL